MMVSLLIRSTLALTVSCAVAGQANGQQTALILAATEASRPARVQDQTPSGKPRDELKKAVEALDKLLDEGIDNGLNASQWYDRLIKDLILGKQSLVSNFTTTLPYGHTFSGWYFGFEELDSILDDASNTNDGIHFDDVKSKLKKARELKKKLEAWLKEAKPAPRQSLLDRVARMDQLLDEGIDNGLNASQWYDELIKDLIRLKLAIVYDFGVEIYGHTFGGWYDLLKEIDDCLLKANATNDGINFDGVKAELKKAREAKKKLEGWLTEASTPSLPKFRAQTQEPDDFKTEHGSRTVPGSQRLPAGSLYATAVVEPDTQVEINQPGYALVAEGEVIQLQRVKPGDKLRAGDTSSVAFDDGTGLMVETKPAATLLPIAVTAGGVLLNGGRHSSGLPVFNGGTTVCVSGSQPFSSVALGAGKTVVTPASVPASMVDASGKTVGQLCTFAGIDPHAVDVTTRDAAGAAQQTVHLQPQVDGTPRVSFDKSVYRAGERGVLRIDNQEQYRQLVETTRFGGSHDLPGSPIFVSGSPNATGLPGAAPFGVRTLPFVASQPGKVDAGVVLPFMVPPQPVGTTPSDQPALRAANGAFSSWARLFRAAR